MINGVIHSTAASAETELRNSAASLGADLLVIDDIGLWRYTWYGVGKAYRRG